VDAIVGAAKQMHTVISELCTGCKLCVAPCPVDCITMPEITPGRSGWDAWSPGQADAARQRHALRAQRLQREARENEARLAAKAAAKLQELNAETQATPAQQADAARKKAIIEAAIARARLRQQEAGTAPPDRAEAP
jgi:electron transport complex protein RnfB